MRGDSVKPDPEIEHAEQVKDPPKTEERTPNPPPSVPYGPDPRRVPTPRQPGDARPH